MADERYDQETHSSQETAVGHSVVEDPGAGAPPPVPAAEPERAEATEVFFSRDEPQQDPTVPTPPTPPPPSDEGKSGGSSPAEADRIAADQEDPFAQKPHVYAFGAF